MPTTDHGLMIKIYESVYLQILVWYIQPYNYPDKKVSQEEDINLPKVPLGHICTAIEKCPPRREKEAPEDESGLDALLKKMLATQMLC